MNESLAEIYPLSSLLAGDLPAGISPADFPRYLSKQPLACAAHPYLPDLANLEEISHQLAVTPVAFPVTVHRKTLNPTIRIVEAKWTGLPEFLCDQSSLKPKSGKALVLLYRPEPESAVRMFTPNGHDLLALKLVAEDISSRDGAVEAGITIGRIDSILADAAQRGLILMPPSNLVREDSYLQGRFAQDEQRVATFTLQWHLTQACDLHCRHCYDRSSRPEMKLAQAIHVLDELYAFSRAHHVHAQVSFSGGNPMLYPHFYEVYREAADRGFSTAILGNPMEEHYIERLVAIKHPEFYQVSLEGLRDHNDSIRGTGHYHRVLRFLQLLRKYRIYSMVMLTLTRDNRHEVLLLADELRGKVNLFTFNRLAMVGEGARLASVDVEDFPQFLKEFVVAKETNDCLCLKDNFFNLTLSEHQRPLTGGCTGFGCGAAFNFVSVLPDGEVHACRKFPSLIGNIFSKSLETIYVGKQATKYRTGSNACFGCRLRPVCRGCPAVTYGFGLDVFTARDPYCFRSLR